MHVLGASAADLNTVLSVCQACGNVQEFVSGIRGAVPCPVTADASMPNAAPKRMDLASMQSTIQL